MTYLINPKWFYWMQVCSSLSFTARLLSVFAIVMIAVCIIGLFLCESCEKDAIMKLKKGLKIFIIIFCIMILPTIFIPDEYTMKEMAVASCVTKENYDAVKGEGKELIDYILEKIEAQKKEK